MLGAGKLSLSEWGLHAIAKVSFLTSVPDPTHKFMGSSIMYVHNDPLSAQSQEYVSMWHMHVGAHVSSLSSLSQKP